MISGYIISMVHLKEKKDWFKYEPSFFKSYYKWHKHSHLVFKILYIYRQVESFRKSTCIGKKKCLKLIEMNPNT